MSQQALQYWLELEGARYAVRVLKGREGISAPFVFDLTFVVEPTAGLDPLMDRIDTTFGPAIYEDQDVRLYQVSSGP